MNGENYILQEGVNADTNIHGCSFDGVYKKVGDPSSDMYCFKEAMTSVGGYQFQCSSTTSSSSATQVMTATTESAAEQVSKIISMIRNYIHENENKPEAAQLSNVLTVLESIQRVLTSTRRKRSTGEKFLDF